MIRLVHSSVFRFLAGALLITVVLMGGLLSDDLSDARDLADRWDLAGAETLLTRIEPQYVSDTSFTRLFAGILLSRGELLRARDQFENLAGLDSLQTRDLLGLGFCLYYLGSLDSAWVVSEHAGILAAQSEDSSALAHIRNLQGLIQFNRGAYDSARDLQTESLRMAERSGDRIARANAMRQLGVLAWYAGRISEAMDRSVAALELYRDANDKIGEATTLSNIGHLYNDKGDRLTAIRYHCEAFDIRRAAGDLRGLADSYYFLTTGPFGAKDRTFSYAFRLKSLELSSRIGYAWGKDVAARALDELPHSQFSIEQTWASAADSALSLSVEGRIHLKWRGARHYLWNKEWERAVPVLDDIIEDCEAQGYEISKRVALRYRALALMELGELANAESTLARENGSEKLDLTISRDLLLARLNLLKGRTTKARRVLTELVASYDSLYLHEMRNPLAGFERAVESVSSLRSEAYRLLIETLRSESPEHMFRMVERERAMPLWIGDHGEFGNQRDLVARFVDLLRHFDDNPADFAAMQELKLFLGGVQQSLLIGGNETGPRTRLRVPESPDIRSVSSVLQPDEVFLEYFVSDRDILILALRNGAAPELVFLNADPQEIASATEVFLGAILRGRTDPRDNVWKSPADFLFSKLLEPLEQRRILNPGTKVVVSPHRFLHSLPFHALANFEDGTTFVAEQYEISYVPSAAVFLRTRERPARPLRSFLTIAPSPGSLPFTAREISDIPPALFETRRDLSGPLAILSNVGSHMRNFDVVHIASHAEASREYPLYSSIELFDRKLRLFELFRFQPPGSMVVLSACETGTMKGLSSDQLNSDELVSFPRAFLQAGVPAVISSMWLAEDSSTADLMSGFYERLADSPSIVHALSGAQRSLIRSERHSELHPFYWAAFTLTGETRLIR